MEKVRVQVHKQSGFETFERGATKGATVGLNLYNADGTLLDLTDLVGGATGTWAPLNGVGTSGTWPISISGVASFVFDFSGNNPFKFWKGLQAEYDALGAWDADTLYVVKD